MYVYTIAKTSLIVILMLVVTSCSMPANDQIPEELHTRIEDLEDRIQTLEFSNEIRSTLESVSRVAYLTPGESGYSLVETNHGLLAISFHDIASYANGSRVTLRIGNTTNADLTGATAQVEWGPVDDAGNADNTEVTVKEVSFGDTLDGGTWTDVQVVLDATPPADVGFVRVSQFNVSSIRLASPVTDYRV